MSYSLQNGVCRNGSFRDGASEPGFLFLYTYWQATPDAVSVWNVFTPGADFGSYVWRIGSAGYIIDNQPLQLADCDPAAGIADLQVLFAGVVLACVVGALLNVVLKKWGIV